MTDLQLYRDGTPDRFIVQLGDRRLGTVTLWPSGRWGAADWHGNCQHVAETPEAAADGLLRWAKSVGVTR